MLESSLQFSSDSGRVLYLADQETNDVFELYDVSSAGGTPIKLNGGLVNGGDVTGALFTPDGSRVVYRADQDSDEVFEMYSISSSGGLPSKLNGLLTGGGDVVSYQITPDGSEVVYLADQNQNDIFELYAVPTMGGVSTRISGDLVNGGDVAQYLISPDGHRVIYRADQDVDEVFELYSVQLVGGLLGNFNEDGLVDAADYTVWRDGLGGKYQLSEYATWKAHFGERMGGGAGQSAEGISTLPEPSEGMLSVFALVVLAQLSRVTTYGLRR